MDISDEDKVKRVTVDNQTTEMQDLKDQIELEKYENQKKAAKSNNGLRFMKGINPGI